MHLLQNKVAVVTGGTRGIGLATVRVFLEQGAKVALLGSRQESVDKTLAQLREQNPDWPLLGFWPALTDEQAVQQTLEKVVAQWGRLDILVNNAGISHSTPLYDYTMADFEKIIDLNVNAVFCCSKAAASIMRQQHSGVILNNQFHGQLLWATGRCRVSCF